MTGRWRSMSQSCATARSGVCDPARIVWTAAAAFL
jgi:hypothetical protein